MAEYERLLRVAWGKEPADLVLRNGLLVNVVTREIYPATVGICEDTIAYVTTPDDANIEAKETIDAAGMWLSPGLIDTHMHIESTHATPAHFADAVLPRGITAVAQDPHEMANIMGLAGIEYMRAAARDLPLRVFTFVSTCVPAVPGLEMSGAEFGPEEVESLLGQADVLGLAEVMDFWGVIRQTPRVSEIVKTGRQRGEIITGHIRGLAGRELNTYLAAGIDSDHEYLSPEGILYRSRLGMVVEICCCQARDNIPQVVEAWKSAGSLDNVVFVTDDIPPEELLAQGHLDQGVRRAIQLGMAPADAIRHASLMPARRIRQHDLGQIAPGRKADILLVNDLDHFQVAATIANGRVVARDGRMIELAASRAPVPAAALDTVHLQHLKASDFCVSGHGTQVNARILTQRARGSRVQSLAVVNGEVDWQSDAELALVSVWHRHGRREGHTHVLLAESGLTGGALATTFSHDSHNLMVIGKNPEDMALAANTLIECGGGFAAVLNGEILACAPLPVAGILADRPVAEIANDFTGFIRAAARLGVTDRPMPLLSSLPLPVVPSCRPTDMGLVDVEKQEFVEPFWYTGE
jgi:adenine deaminase